VSAESNRSKRPVRMLRTSRSMPTAAVAAPRSVALCAIPTSYLSSPDAKPGSDGAVALRRIGSGEGGQPLVVRRQLGLRAVVRCALTREPLGAVEMAVHADRFPLVRLRPLHQQRAEHQQPDQVAGCPEQPAADR